MAGAFALGWFATPAVTVEQGPRLDRQHIVVDVAEHACRRGQGDLARADAAGDVAADADLLGGDRAADDGVLADGQRLDLDIALDLAGDMKLAIALEVAFDHHLRADDRRDDPGIIACLPFRVFCEHLTLPSKS